MMKLEPVDLLIDNTKLCERRRMCERLNKFIFLCLLPSLLVEVVFYWKKRNNDSIVYVIAFYKKKWGILWY